MQRPNGKLFFFNRALFGLAWILLSFFFGGCGTTYRQAMEPVKVDFYRGNTQMALNGMNEAVALEDSNKPIYLLERALIHQRMGNFKAAQEDLIEADEWLEILDFTDNTSETLKEYTLSPSMTLYRGQPHEKILLNTLNMLNFIAEGDLSAARVEARRADEMYRYQVEVEERFNYKNPLTTLLYGLVFDASKRPNDAYVAYRNAYEMGGFDFLKPRLLHAAQAIRHSDYRKWQRTFGNLPPPVPEGRGTLLTVVMNGRTPIRVEGETEVPPELMSIIHQGISCGTLGKKRIRYPEMVKRSHRFREGHVTIDSASPQRLVHALDVEAQAMTRFDEERFNIISACVTRFLIRAAVTGAASSLIQKQANKSGYTLSDDAIGAIESLFDTGLSELDVPDVRCWNLLPAEVLLSLDAVPAGEHTVTLEMSGDRPARQNKTVRVEAGGLTMAQFFVTD